MSEKHALRTCPDNITACGHAVKFFESATPAPSPVGTASARRLSPKGRGAENKLRGIF